MENTPSLSIIIPLYKAEPHLPVLFRTLELQGVVAREGHVPPIDVEILMVDDGSPDGTVNAIKDYAAAHPNVILLTQPNSGQGEARNNGLRHAKMKYVYLMDQDDLLVPDTLIPMTQRLHALGGDTIRFKCEHIEPSMIEQNLTRPAAAPTQEEKIMTGEEYISATNGLEKDCTVWTGIISREFIISHNCRFIPEVRFLEDVVFMWQVMIHATRVIVTDRYGYRWVTWPGSDSNIRDPRHIFARRATLPHVARFFRSLPRSGNPAVDRNIGMKAAWHTFAYWSMVLGMKPMTRREALDELDRQTRDGIYPYSELYPSDHPELYPTGLPIRMRWYALSRPYILRILLSLILK